MTSPHRLPPFDSDGYDREIKLARRQRKPTGKPTTNGRALPQPKQLSSGRWKATVTVRGVRHRQIFDTKAEAEQYIRQIKRGA